MPARRVLFSAQKNEGPFILEWVAYHKVIGFTDIIVVSNDCDDGSDDLLDLLQDRGLLVHIRQDVPTGIAPQKSAEQTARARGLFIDGDWVMWLDLDEFLLPSIEDKKLDAMIKAIGNVDAVMVAWRFFGDSGNQNWPGRHISPSFTKAAKRFRGKNSQVKTLFRYSPKIERLDIHRPILNADVLAKDFSVITSGREPASQEFYNRNRKNPYNRMNETAYPYRLGQVIHFAIRTPDMYLMKQNRGDGYYPDGSDAVIRDDTFYRKKNLNSVDESAHLIHEKETYEMMRALYSDPKIRKCCDGITEFKWLDLLENTAPK